MYEIYETESFVFRSYNSSENNKRTLIFSKDFGLIWVDSSGSRKEVSKFRPFIQDFSHLKIFLVRGKMKFRVTGGDLISNIFFDFKENKKQKIIPLKNFFSLIEKVLIKNHREEDIFDLLVSFIFELKKTFLGDLKKVEIIFTVKLLILVGYFNEEFLEERGIDFNEKVENIELNENEIKRIIREINEQLRKIAF